MRSAILALLPCVLLLAAPAGTPKPDPLLLRTYQDSHPGVRGDAAARAVARREAAWIQAGRGGLLQGSAWSAFQRKARSQALVKAYVESRPGHPLPSEEQAKTAYLNQGEERRIWHLLSPDKGKAEAALKRLKKGEDPGALAAELSADPGAKQNRGELGWIRKAQVVAAFGEAAFGTAVGGLAGPVQTEFGWHVLKVLEARKPTLDGWTREGAGFRARLAETYLGMKQEAALQELRGRYPLEKRTAVLGLDRTTLVAAGDEKRIAGKVAGRGISLRELKLYLQDVLKAMGSGHSLGPEMKGRMMEGLADQLRLEAAARAAGVERLPGYRACLWDMERETALERFSARYLERLKIADPELDAHRKAHPERFLAPGALRVQLLAFDGPTAAQTALREAAAGTAWADLYQRHADKAATGNWNAGWLEVAALRTTLAEADVQRLLRSELNATVGPLQGPDGPMLFKVLERRPGPLLPLEQCRRAVRDDLLRETGAARVTAFLDREAGIQGAVGVR